MSIYDKYDHHTLVCEAERLRCALVRLCWNLVADEAACDCGTDDACPPCEAFQALGYEKWPGAEMAAALLTVEVGP